MAFVHAAAATLYRGMTAQQSLRVIKYTDHIGSATPCTLHRCQPLQKSAAKIARDFASVMREPRLTSMPVKRLFAAASACRPSCTACTADRAQSAPAQT